MTQPEANLEIIFSDLQSGMVTFTLSDVAVIRYITPEEIGVTKANGSLARYPLKNEKLEIVRVEKPVVTQQKHKDDQHTTRFQRKRVGVMLAAGYSNAEIANAMGITEDTVRHILNPQRSN